MMHTDKQSFIDIRFKFHGLSYLTILVDPVMCSSVSHNQHQT
jgi:hypothetical protein